MRKETSMRHQRKRCLLTSSASKVCCSNEDQPTLQFDGDILSSKRDTRSVYFKMALTDDPEMGLESRACCCNLDPRNKRSQCGNGAVPDEVLSCCTLKLNGTEQTNFEKLSMQFDTLMIHIGTESTKTKTPRCSKLKETLRDEGSAAMLL